MYNGVFMLKEYEIDLHNAIKLNESNTWQTASYHDRLVNGIFVAAGLYSDINS